MAITSTSAFLPSRKHLGGDVLRMLAYNGSIPGPTLHVDQGSEAHGPRQERRRPRDDGALAWPAPGEPLRRCPASRRSRRSRSAAPTPRRSRFPTPGFYWYHPHIREDYGLELGLYGTIIVEPSDPSYWPPADRHLTITLDDLLVEDGKVAPFSRSGPTYTAMGRFGNVMLINGDTRPSRRRPRSAKSFASTS